MRTLVICAILGLITMASCNSVTVHAQETEIKQIDNKKAVAAIVGEAAGESYKCKLAIACVIRNRGSLQGVYGVNAKHNATEPPKIWAEAFKAWNQSKTNDITGGCMFWGGKMDIPYFEVKLKKAPVLIINGTRFYK